MLHASSPHSVALMQLRFTSLTVVSSREDLHLQECAHAGRTTEKRRLSGAVFYGRRSRVAVIPPSCKRLQSVTNATYSPVCGSGIGRCPPASSYQSSG